MKASDKLRNAAKELAIEAGKALDEGLYDLYKALKHEAEELHREADDLEKDGL